MTETPQLSGVDLARVALRAAKVVAQKNGGGRTAQPKTRTTSVVRRGGREPMGLGAAIGALVTERAWELPAAGATLRERWAATAPEPTPAVQRIIQARSAAAPAKWTPGQNTDTAQDTRARELLRKLLYARRTESIALADSVCREISDLASVGPRLQEQLDAALRSGLLWIEKEVGARRGLFASLEQAVAEKQAGKVKKLLRQAKTAAKDACSEEESRVIDAADGFLTAIAAARSKHLNTLLDDLDQLPSDPDPDVLRIKVRELLRAASEAGSIGPHRQAKVEAWRERVRRTAGPLQPGQGKRLPLLQG
ncbi:hypothetical protein ABZ137_36810 [Streptomyces bobili]|uniref:hypothetical protein n=1 Tax=Streptomyces bobili TaxID=67280 RepID=UPI0033B8EBEE